MWKQKRTKGQTCLKQGTATELSVWAVRHKKNTASHGSLNKNVYFGENTPNVTGSQPRGNKPKSVQDLFFTLQRTKEKYRRKMQLPAIAV